MKKFFAIILVLCMFPAVVACDGGVEKPTETEPVTETEAATVPVAEESTVKESNIEESNVEESNAEESNVEESNVEESNDEETAAVESDGAAESSDVSETVEATEENTLEETTKETVTDAESEKLTETESEKVKETEFETIKETESETEPEAEPETERPTLEENAEPASSVLATVDYYFGVEHKEFERELYFNGKIDGFYATASLSPADAVRVRLEETEGGYFLYFVKNARKYYINIGFVAVLGVLEFDEYEAKTVFEFDAELKTLVTKYEDKTLYLGMYGDQRVFTVSDVKYANESYVAHLYEAICDHAYLADDYRHGTLACAKCGAPAGDIEPHGETYQVSEVGKRTTYCAECGYVVKTELCNGNHWLSDKDGHWEGACDICGTASGAKMEHGTLIADYMTSTSYSLGCATCGYAYYTKAIPESVSYFMTPMTWAKNATTYYQVNSTGSGSKTGTIAYDADGLAYGSVKGNSTDEDPDKHGQVLYNRTNSDTKGSDAQQYSFDVGNAKFLVIKVRTNENTQSFSLAFSTAGKDGIKSFKIPLGKLTNDEWGVIVIDLGTVFGEYYAKEAGAASYLVDSFYLTMNYFKATTAIDIAYMAFVEGGFEDVDALVDEAKAFYASGSSITEVNIGEKPEGEKPEGEKHEGEKPEGEKPEGEKPEGEKPEGEKPEGEKPEGEKPEGEGANFYISPEFIRDNAGKQGTHDKTVMVENGVSFVRIDNFVTAGSKDKWGGLDILNSDVGVTGQYLVMKIRVGENGLNQTYLSMFIRSTGSDLVAGMKVDVKVAEDGEWHVIVVDLAERVQDAATYFGKDSDGKYHARYLQFRPFSNNQVAAEADDYTDIAYIAFFDDLADLDDIVDETTYEWSLSKSESSVLKVSDHSCAAHTADAIQKEIRGDDTVYYATCKSCDERCYERVVPESVTKYYDAKGFAKDATTYYQAGKGTVEYDPEHAVVFGSESGNLQVLWHRAQTDVPSSTRSSQTTTMDVGNARFLVIRLRTSNTERTLKLNYSTTAKNSNTGEATAANEKAYKSDGTKGVEVGDIINIDAGYTTVTFPISGINEDEWTTFVIDLNAVMGDYHAKVEGETSYVVDTFYIDENNKVGNLDVEYMAFVEGDWSDVGALVGAGEVINITSKDGTFEKKALTAAQ